MSFPTKRRGFWLILIAALFLSVVSASLGVWQLARANYKKKLEFDIQNAQSKSVVINSDIKPIEKLDPWLHRPAELTGYWVSEATVFLDNRQMNGRQGFYVLTPLRLESDGRWLMVQRGWTPRNFQDRTRTPVIPTSAGLVSVSGRIATAPGKVYQIGEDVKGHIRQNIDLVTFGQEQKAVFLNGSLIQSAPLEANIGDGLLRNWPQVASGVQKHYGYAFQWFGLCALIVILYVWFQILPPIKRSCCSRAAR